MKFRLNGLFCVLNLMRNSARTSEIQGQRLVWCVEECKRHSAEVWKLGLEKVFVLVVKANGVCRYGHTLGKDNNNILSEVHDFMERGTNDRDRQKHVRQRME